MTIVFIGDVHQRWDLVERGLASLDALPAAAVLLGDMQCDRPLDEVAAPLLDRGIPLCTGSSATTTTTAGRRCGRTWSIPPQPARPPRGALHGRVVDHRRAARGRSGRDVPPAHLGTARAAAPAIAAPSCGPTCATSARWREEHLDALIAFARPAGDLAGGCRCAGLPARRHPGHARGSRAAIPPASRSLDELARAMGARLIVHGHHHITYRAVAPDGLRAMGVAAAWGSAMMARNAVVRRGAAASGTDVERLVAGDLTKTKSRHDRDRGTGRGRSPTRTC